MLIPFPPRCTPASPKPVVFCTFPGWGRARSSWPVVGAGLGPRCTARCCRSQLPEGSVGWEAADPLLWVVRHRDHLCPRRLFANVSAERGGERWGGGVPS